MPWLILILLIMLGGMIWFVMRQRSKEPTLSANLEQNVDSFLNEAGQTVEPAIKELLSVHAGSKFPGGFVYQIDTGGKRLRPALVFLSCRAVGGQDQAALYAAAAVEILHNYSLIIDDMIDHGQVRRGLPTTWKKWGHSMAQCFGVHYAAAIFEGALKTPAPLKATSILTETLQVLLEGEMLDILQERAGRETEALVVQRRYRRVSMNDYLEMASKKTAKLLAASCQLGAVCAHASEAEQKALIEYGYNLGMAFQVRDDILDMFGEEKGFGKKIGKDIEERKGGNAVILFALEELEDLELDRLLHQENLEETDIKRAIEIISQTKAREKAIKLCQDYTDRAKNALKGLPASPDRDLLADLVDYLMARHK